MRSSYHINPGDYTIEYLHKNLLSRELIPSREPLKEDLENKFRILKESGIETLEDLINGLKNKRKLEEFSVSSGISIEYLTLLRREANSYLPNPDPLSKFPGVSAEVISKLNKLGIKNSRQMYEQAGSEIDRAKLADLTGISQEELKELVGLSDLVRAYGVGPVFARILYDTGIPSIQDLISYTPEQIIQLYEDKFHQKADFSLRDMNFSMEIAKSLDIGLKL